MRALTSGQALAVFLGSSVLGACADGFEPRGAPPPAVQPAPPLGSAPPEPARNEHLLGVVLASEAVELSAPFDGRLAWLRVQPGEGVQAGTELGGMALETLRSEEQQAQALLEQAEAALRRAELEAHEATERLQRYEKSPPGVFSTDELSTARYQEKFALTQVATERGRIREQRAALEGLRQRLAEARILAPFDCIVAVRYLDAGARVQAGTPLLRIIRAGEFRVRFALPEARSGKATPGLPINVFLPALGKAFPAEIESLAPEVDAASRMVFALATLRAPTEAVRAGMAARVSLEPKLSSATPTSSGAPPAKHSGE